MVDLAEHVLHDLGFEQLRVRYHHDDVARIEVPVSDLPRLLNKENRCRVVTHLKQAGFRYVSVDLEGFRSGSMNAALAAESLEIAEKPAKPSDA